MSDAVIQPIGAAACTFLRRVRFAGEPLHAEPYELALARRCLDAGYLQRVPEQPRSFQITRAGAAYLDKLARVN